MSPTTITDKDDLLLTQQLLDIVKMVQDREFIRAREVLLPLLSQHCKDYRLWHLAGIIASQANNQKQAIIYLKQALQLSPKQIEPVLNLARVYAMQQDFNMAASCYLKVLELDEKNEAALHGFSIILINAGKYQKAEEFIHRWLAIRKNVEAYQLLIQIKIAQKQYDEVFSLYDEMRAIQPDNFNIALQAANFYTMVGDYQTAISQYKTLLEQYHDNVEILRQLAFTYYLTQDYAQAEHFFNAVLAIAPDDISSLNNLSCVYKDLGDYQKAKQILLQLVDNNQATASIYANLANVSLCLKDYEQAKKYYQQALALEPGNKDILALAKKNPILK